jgi:uncharacterized membrane protein
MVPFVTGWMGENHFTPVPMAFYGIMLLMAAISYYILQTRIIRSHGPDSLLARAVGSDLKGKISPFMYILGILSTWILPWISGAIYLLVALMWLIPDRRIEIIFRNEADNEK